MQLNETFVITECWTNGTVTLQYGAIKTSCSIRCINPYTYYSNVEDINTENMYDNVNI